MLHTNKARKTMNAKLEAELRIFRDIKHSRPKMIDNARARLISVMSGRDEMAVYATKTISKCMTAIMEDHVILAKDAIERHLSEEKQEAPQPELDSTVRSDGDKTPTPEWLVDHMFRLEDKNARLYRSMQHPRITVQFYDGGRVTLYLFGQEVRDMILNKHIYLAGDLLGCHIGESYPEDWTVNAQRLIEHGMSYYEPENYYIGPGCVFFVRLYQDKVLVSFDGKSFPCLKDNKWSTLVAFYASFSIELKPKDQCDADE